jgi:hypothetical protein
MVCEPSAGKNPTQAWVRPAPAQDAFRAAFPF